MKKKTKKELALHLIKEDLRYHLMVANCHNVDIHIHYYPDMASVVKTLLGQDRGGEEWDSTYVAQMAKANALNWEVTSDLDVMANLTLTSLMRLM